MKYDGRYHGITYLGILRWVWPSWFCKRGMHLWDEVWSAHLHEEGDNYLHCDACGDYVFIHAVKKGTKPIGIDVPWYSILWEDVRRLYYHLRDMDEPEGG